MLTLAIALLIGLAAGVLSGLFGIAGGVVIVPALVLILHLTQKAAIGTSLAALLLPVGILAVIAYAREGHVRFPIATAVAVGLTLGAGLGARIGTGVADVTLRRLFALLLVAVAVRLVLVR